MGNSLHSGELPMGLNEFEVWGLRGGSCGQAGPSLAFIAQGVRSQSAGFGGRLRVQSFGFTVQGFGFRARGLELCVVGVFRSEASGTWVDKDHV